MGFFELAKRKARELELNRKTKKTEPEEVKDLDHFFTSEVLPSLTALYKNGRLPDLAKCPLWAEVDRLWGVPDPDVEKVKEAMRAALEMYEKPDTLF